MVQPLSMLGLASKVPLTQASKGRSGAGHDYPGAQDVQLPSPSLENLPAPHLVIKLSLLETEQS